MAVGTAAAVSVGDAPPLIPCPAASFGLKGRRAPIGVSDAGKPRVRRTRFFRLSASGVYLCFPLVPSLARRHPGRGESARVLLLLAARTSFSKRLISRSP